MFNDLVLSETGLKEITCIVLWRKLRISAHPRACGAASCKDLAHRILCFPNPVFSGSGGGTMPRCRPHASWFRQVQFYLKDMGVAGLASAWMMAVHTQKYCRKMYAATRCSAVYIYT